MKLSINKKLVKLNPEAFRKWFAKKWFCKVHPSMKDDWMKYYRSIGGKVESKKGK